MDTSKGNLNFTVQYIDPADDGKTTKNFTEQSQAQVLALCTKYLGDSTLKVLSLNILTGAGIGIMQAARQAQAQRQQIAAVPSQTSKAFTNNKKK